MIPPHLKASNQTGKKPRKKQKAGGQPGHPGHTRRQPDHIDRREEHRLDCCPNCGGPLQRCNGKKSIRLRIIEDIPASITPEMTEHRIHRDYCPRCQKPVEPPVANAFTHSRIVHCLLVLTTYWHYALRQIRHSAVLHADETGWRVNGVTHWL